MEILVHVQVEQLLQAAYVLIEATFNDDLVDVIPAAKLPKDWNANPVPVSVQQYR